MHETWQTNSRFCLYQSKNFSALLKIDFQFFEENEKKFTPNLINCVDLPVSDHGKDVPYSSSGYVCSQKQICPLLSNSLLTNYLVNYRKKASKTYFMYYYFHVGCCSSSHDGSFPTPIHFMSIPLIVFVELPLTNLCIFTG